jgi:hypothetical protein
MARKPTTKGSKKTSSKRVTRSAVTGRFVKSPAKAGSLKFRQVDKAITKVSSSGSKAKSSGSSKARSSQASKMRASR